MARPLRFIQEGGALVEVTTRTFQSRLLLTPKPLLNRIIIGALARASHRYGVQVVAMAFLSNHYHLVLWVEDARQLARLMTYFNSKLAREIGRLTGLAAESLVPPLSSHCHQRGRGSAGGAPDLRALEWGQGRARRKGLGLARRARRPAPALLSGLPLEGVWYDRTQEYLSKLKRKKTNPDRFAEPETLTLSPLPCWKHLSPEAYRARIESLIRKIDADAAAQREAGTNLSEPMRSCARIRGPSRTGPRSRQPLGFTPSGSGSAKSSTRPTPSSCRPTARPPSC